MAFAGTAQASIQHVVNGSFESLLLPGVASQFGSDYPSQQVTGWVTSGYNFVFTPGSADTTGALEQYGCCLTLYGPGNGHANGLPATSPDGGNYLAADANFDNHTQPITQTITGLTIGETATLTFYWASAQQFGYQGPTTEAWTASLGGGTGQTTAVESNSEAGFTAWTQVTDTFTVTAATEDLSFLASGTPNGQPPFSLLDGVSLTTPSPTPEPGYLALLGIGVAGLFAARKRFGKSAV